MLGGYVYKKKTSVKKSTNSYTKAGSRNKSRRNKSRRNKTRRNKSRRS